MKKKNKVLYLIPFSHVSFSSAASCSAVSVSLTFCIGKKKKKKALSSFVRSIKTFIVMCVSVYE